MDNVLKVTPLIQHKPERARSARSPRTTRRSEARGKNKSADQLDSNSSYWHRPRRGRAAGRLQDTPHLHGRVQLQYGYSSRTNDTPHLHGRGGATIGMEVTTCCTGWTKFCSPTSNELLRA